MSADNTKAPEGAPKAVTTAAVEIDKEKSAEIRKSQANYKGNTHFDLVKVEIVKDGSFYKKGDTDEVHPTVAEILKAKGLVK